jgi:hypothetical protein
VIPLLIIVVAALVVRALAPDYVKHAVNRRLAKIPGYGGSVKTVRLHLWRGAYEIDEMTIVKSSGKVREPFFSAKTIDFSIAWRDLFRGRLVSDIYVADGHLVFERGPTEESSQLNADKRWQDVINDLFPIDITRLVIDGGIVEFIDTTRNPKVDVSVRGLHVVATGLRNRQPPGSTEFPASIDLSGTTIGGGNLRLYVKLEPLALQARFQLAAELKGVSLPALNDFLKAYGDIAASQGQFEVFAQMAMQKGHYEGYVKPFIKDVEFKSADEGDHNLGKRLWLDVVSAVSDLFKNSKTKQIATRIPFEGDAKGMDVRTLRTILNGLHHGFVKALPQAFEGTTHPDSGPTLPPLAAQPEEKPSK